MAMTLAINVDTASVLSNLARSQCAVSANIQKLTSGLRITKAGGGAAGLSISEQLKAEIRSFSRRNAQDGISASQVVEGALNEIHGALIRMKELAVQSANGTNSDTTRSFIHEEYSALRSEIDRIADSTDGSNPNLLNEMVVFASQLRARSLGALSGTSLAGTSVSTVGMALEAIRSIDRAITDVSDVQSCIGVVQNNSTRVSDSLAPSLENFFAASSRVRDLFVATETSERTRKQVLSQPGVSGLAQANPLPSVGLSLLR